MSKLFKFWRYRLELKLKKIPDEKKIELLANKLVKELNLNIDDICHSVTLWIHKKEDLEVESKDGDSYSRICCKYKGK